MELLADLPFVAPVKVLHVGPVRDLATLTGMIGPSHFIAADHLDRLDALCRERQLDPLQIRRETDSSLLMEGLYIKQEEGGVVRERYKYVRPGFLQSLLDSQSHWLDRPILPNQLAAGVSLF
jgi:hypothetical protein